MKIRWMGMALFLVLVGLAVSGCGGSGGNSPVTSIDGVWKTDGYGWTVQLANGKAELYQTTSMSGLKIFEGTYAGNQITLQLGDARVPMTITRENGRMVLDTHFGKYDLTRLESLPTPCQNGGTPMTQDPEVNFEVFWHTMNEQYAFFQLRGVDWQAQYNTYRPQVTKDTTPDELYRILCRMITPLNDSHCSIAKSETEEFRTYDVATALNLQQKCQSDAGLVPVGEEGYIAYRSLSSATGLIVIYNMDGYNQTGDPDAEAKELDQVLQALAGKSRLIIDMRFNLGGMDTVSLALAGRFADQKRLAFSKQARDGNGLTPIRRFYVEPQGSQRFTGNVTVLTSRFTVSAGETFIMAMQALPNVTIMGDRTNGAHSDILDRTLPNGWSFGLSNERYLASDGNCYEKIGLEPDVPMSFDANAYLSGTDSMMQAALDAKSPRSKRG